MPTIPSYDNVTANQLTGSEDILLADPTLKNITPAELKKYVNRADVNTQTGSYTLVLADEGKVVRMNVAGANNLTVPPNSSVAFAIGTQIVVRQVGAGLTTIVQGSGVTVNAVSLELNGQNTAAVLHKVGTNSWDLYLGSGEAEADVTAPTVSSATAINSTTIRVVFSETVTATNVGWSFKKNGVAHNPSAVSGSGTNTLDFTVGTMLNTDTILRSYNSGTGDTMDTSSNELVSFTDQAVTNSISDSGAPTFVSAVIENAAPSNLVMTYSETLDGTSDPATGDFIVDRDGSPTTVSTANASGTTVTLGLASPALAGEVFTVTYIPNIDPGEPRIKDLAGNAAITLTDAAVTNNVAGAYDSDAEAFFTASGVSNTTQKDAVDALVVALKAASLWADMKAIYPLVGGTSTTHKFNLRNPLDTDGAYRLVFGGTGIAHSSNGIDFNGTAYADTRGAAGTIASNQDVSFGYYSRENGPSASDYEMGTFNGTNGLGFAFDQGSGSGYLVAGDQSITTPTAKGAGLLVLTSGPLGTRLFHNGVVYAGDGYGAPNNVAVTSNYFIGNIWNNTANSTTLECAFAFIHDGVLTAGQVSDLYDIIQDFQTALSRQV